MIGKLVAVFNWKIRIQYTSYTMWETLITQIKDDSRGGWDSLYWVIIFLVFIITKPQSFNGNVLKYLFHMTLWSFCDIYDFVYDIPLVFIYIYAVFLGWDVYYVCVTLTMYFYESLTLNWELQLYFAERRWVHARGLTKHRCSIWVGQSDVVGREVL